MRIEIVRFMAVRALLWMHPLFGAIRSSPRPPSTDHRPRVPAQMSSGWSSTMNVLSAAIEKLGETTTLAQVVVANSAVCNPDVDEYVQTALLIRLRI